jgi:hypothetical protein
MRMMNEFEAQVLSDLSVLKTQMNGLMGDGNGGRIADLERRMGSWPQSAFSLLSFRRWSKPGTAIKGSKTL